MFPQAVPAAEPTPHDNAFLQVLAHRTMLKSYILVIVRDPHLAEDTLSDVTLAIVRSWERFDAGQPFGPWARGVARRVALTNLRKYRRANVALSDEVLEQLEDDFDAFGSEADQEEQRQQLRSCVQLLPERSRELIQLRYFDGQSYDQIARLTNRTVAA